MKHKPTGNPRLDRPNVCAVIACPSKGKPLGSVYLAAPLLKRGCPRFEIKICFDCYERLTTPGGKGAPARAANGISATIRGKKRIIK